MMQQEPGDLLRLFHYVTHIDLDHSLAAVSICVTAL